VRPQKTAQESEVACKNKEPLFGLKLGLSNLTGTAYLHREPRASPQQGFYWGRAGGRTFHPRGEQIGCYSGQGVLAYWNWFLLHCVLVIRNVARVIPFFGQLGQRPALLNYDWIRAEVCIPEEDSCPGYGAFQRRGCAQVSAKEQRSLSLK
jgi:hypothetical protein